SSACALPRSYARYLLLSRLDAAAAQKSDLSAWGTATFLPEYSCVFSAQTFSNHGFAARRYVAEPDQGLVKNFLSSTVNRTCRPLPLSLASMNAACSVAGRPYSRSLRSCACRAASPSIKR